MSEELVKATPTALATVDPNIWSTILMIAPALHAAHFYNVSSPEQAATIMLMGHELGFGLSASFEYIHIIQGKPCLSPRGAMAIILASGKMVAWKHEPAEHAYSFWAKRRDGLDYGLTWSLADAKLAGLDKDESNWKKYEKNMLKWRCIGFVFDVLFPDVLGGMKRADEFGAWVTDAGDVIEGEVAA